VIVLFSFRKVSWRQITEGCMWDSSMSNSSLLACKPRMFHWTSFRKILLLLVMATLCNRAGHYIFVL